MSIPTVSTFSKPLIWAAPNHSPAATLASEAREEDRTLRKDVFLPPKHLISAFYEMLLAKSPSRNLVFTENPYRRLLKPPFSEALALKESFKNPSKSRVLLHDPLGVHPTDRLLDGQVLSSFLSTEPKARPWPLTQVWLRVLPRSSSPRSG